MKQILFFIIGISPITSSYAITLWQALESAKYHSQKYKIAEYELNAKQEVAIQAKSQLMPQINLSTNYNNRAQSNFDQYQTYGWDIKLNQPIYDKTKWTKYQAEKIATTIANSDYNKASEDTSLEVIKSYFDTLIIKAQLTALKEEKKVYQLQISQSNALFSLGRATIIESHEAQSEFDKLLVKEINLKTKLTTEANRFESLTGFNSNKIQSTNLTNLPNWLKQYSEEKWIKKAIKNNIKINNQLLKVKQGKANLTVFESEKHPDINLTIGYQDSFTKATRSNGEDVNSRGKGAYLGLNMNIPIYSGGYKSSKIRQNKAILNQQIAILREYNNQVKLETKQAYAVLVGHRAQIMAQRQVLMTNTVKLKSITLGKTYGVKSYLDESNAKKDKIKAQYDLIEAKYLYITDYFKLLHLTGILSSPQSKHIINHLFK